MSKRILIAAALACASATLGPPDTLQAGAQDMPDSLSDVVRVEFLPGWKMEDGTRMAGLSFDLAPGWKTYWRSPGDGGLPTYIGTRGSMNLQSMAILWPRPEVFRTGNLRSIGYRDAVVLPLHLVPNNDGPMNVNLSVKFGICEDVCIPVHMRFDHQFTSTSGAGAELIADALEERPRMASGPVKCSFERISNGVAVTVGLHSEALAGKGEALVIETPNPRIWISEPSVSRDGDYVRGAAEFISEDIEPIRINPADIEFTLISSRDAVSFSGCERQ